MSGATVVLVVLIAYNIYYRAREADFGRALQIEDAMKQPVEYNSRNDLLHRMQRNTQRATTSARKAAEKSTMQAREAEVRAQIQKEKDARKESLAREKTLRESLGTGKRDAPLKTTGTQARIAPDVDGGSSCGRVPSSLTLLPKARTASAPYPARRKSL